MKNKIKDVTRKMLEDLNVKADFSSRNISEIKTGSVVVIGMRRLGKTEYLKYRASMESEKDKIVFLNLDSTTLSEIDFSTIDSPSFVEFKNALIFHIKDSNIKLLLLDEIQVWKHWSRFLKGLKDDFPNLTIVATGSDALELNKSNERGIGRYVIRYMGPLAFNEYLKMSFGKKMSSKMEMLYDHLENWITPNDDYKNPHELFDAMYLRQMNESNFSRGNIRAVLRTIALNPGSGASISAFVKQIKETTDFKPSYDQVSEIIKFLEESELIIRLDSETSLSKISKTYNSKFYPTNWNLYKVFVADATYESLNETSNPRRGFVFENYVISNIISCSHSMMERYNLYYGSDANDSDIVINEVSYEIKSFDVFFSERMRDVIEKCKRRESIIIHTGETKEFEGVRLINVAEFLENKMWMYLKNRQ